MSTKDVLGMAPRFEKMLCDNALLSRVYLHAYQTSGDPFFRRVVEETLDYVLREMTFVGACVNEQQMLPRQHLPSNAPGIAGGFYSTQDADSEGEEGWFFVWTLDEVDALLRVTPERLSEVVERGEQILFEAREKWVKPGRGDKVLTAWSGLTLASMAEVTGFKVVQARVHKVIGQVALCRSALQEVLKACRTALELLGQADQPWRKDITHTLGRAHLTQGNREIAVSRFCEAIVLPSFIGFIGPHPPVLGGLESAYADPEAFRDFCRRFRETHVGVGGLPAVQWFLEPSIAAAVRSSPLQTYPVCVTLEYWKALPQLRMQGDQ